MVQQATIHGVIVLQAEVDVDALTLFRDLVDNAAAMPQWNPTILEVRTLEQVDDNTDISYNIAAEGAGGMVSSRWVTCITIHVSIVVSEIIASTTKLLTCSYGTSTLKYFPSTCIWMLIFELNLYTCIILYKIARNNTSASCCFLLFKIIVNKHL